MIHFIHSNITRRENISIVIKHSNNLYILIFPVKTKSNFKKAIVGKRGKNKVDLKLEEHVFVENEDELTFDHHGREIKFPFKLAAND